MEINILNDIHYPTTEDWDLIYSKKREALNSISFKLEEEVNYGSFEEFIFDSKVRNWIMEFNNRSFDLATNYVLLMFYYNKGIPDDEWKISPGKKGVGISYYPHLEEKHHKYMHWFWFYMESYYSRFESMFDAVYHLINEKFNLKVKEGSRFRSNVLDKLEHIDKGLHRYLVSIRRGKRGKIYKEVNRYRNNIIHNYRPNQINFAPTETTSPNGSRRISYGAGSYTTSTEFVRNIEESLDLLSSMINEVRGKIEWHS